jgi:hypothetical protein
MAPIRFFMAFPPLIKILQEMMARRTDLYSASEALVLETLGPV